MLELFRLPAEILLVALIVLGLRALPVLLRELIRWKAARQALRGRTKVEHERACRVLELMTDRQPPDPPDG